jgi:hypothetical protein
MEKAMSRNRSMILLVSALAGGFTLVSAPAEQPTSSPRVEPADRFAYHDDHDGRRLADIRVQVIERDGVKSLQLSISAVGPQVETIPGFAGVRGANRYTAEQIENILSGRFSFAVKTRVDGSAPWSGQWRAGRRGPIPERRLGPDGRIDFLAVTPRDYPLELIVDTGRVVDGRQTTELWFDGVPRLRLSYQVAGNRARIVAFQSLGSIPASDTVRADEPKGDKTRPAEEIQKLPVTNAEWNARDVEGRWLLYQSLVQRDGKHARAFVPFLVERGDFDFLELIALHQPLYQGGIAAAWGLARADAPQWMRVAAWQRQMEIDHGESETSKMVLKHNPAKALAWLEKYAAEAIITDGETENPRLRGRANSISEDLKALRKMKLKAADLGSALPPLQPGDAFRYLDAPPELAEFGDRLRGERGKVYVHQVLRAIHGFVQSGRFREPWLGKVLKLTRHPHLQVRQAALLAHVDLAGYLDPKDSPVDEFRKVLDDAKEPAVIREAAVMAFSSFGHPQVAVRLHELARESTHPGWRAAISRLNDLGDEFTLQHLSQIDKSRLAATDAEVLEKSRTALKRWAEDPQRNRTLSESAVARLLERAAWAEQTKSPLAKALTAWTKAFLVGQRDDQVLEHLIAVGNTYEPRDTVPDTDALTRRVRELAKEIAVMPRRDQK